MGFNKEIHFGTGMWKSKTYVPSLYASAGRNLTLVRVSAWATSLVYLEMPFWGACVRNEGMKGKKGNRSELCSHSGHHLEGQVCDLVGPQRILAEKFSLWDMSWDALRSPCVKLFDVRGGEAPTVHTGWCERRTLLNASEKGVRKKWKQTSPKCSGCWTETIKWIIRLKEKHLVSLHCEC